MIFFMIFSGDSVVSAHVVVSGEDRRGVAADLAGPLEAALGPGGFEASGRMFYPTNLSQPSIPNVNVIWGFF